MKPSPYIFPGLVKNYKLNPVDFICQWRGVTRERLLRRDRRTSIKEARHIAMWLAVSIERLNTGKRHWSKIAQEYFPGYDHSTIVHAWRTVSEQFEVSRDFRQRLRLIVKKLEREHEIKIVIEDELFL